MQSILDYLTERYRPIGMAVYGSYADGSQNQNSDFDAILLADIAEPACDNSVVEGVLLDVFLYPADTFQKPFAAEDWLQLFDANILLDETNALQFAKEQVNRYIQNQPVKTKQQLLHDVIWCEKMLARTARGDAEGLYRHHWLLTESLSIYCDLKRLYYFGPKKAIKRMQREDAESFSLYKTALASFDEASLSAWVAHLRALWQGRADE